MTRLTDAWAALRAILSNEFSFYSIKEIVGLAGLDVTKLARLEQKAGGGATKGQLITAIDRELGETFGDDRTRFIGIVAEEVLNRRPDVEDQLHEHLSRLGWAAVDGEIVPLELFDPEELSELPEEPRAELVKAGRRFRDGDLSGAVSAACGAVDTVTSSIYKEYALGDAAAASFQERCKKALRAVDFKGRLESDLSGLDWAEERSRPFCKNFEGALVQGAYVMQSLRSNMGDVHGTKPTLKPVVFDCLKWAEMLIRAYESR